MKAFPLARIQFSDSHFFENERMSQGDLKYYLRKQRMFLKQEDINTIM